MYSASFLSYSKIISETKRSLEKLSIRFCLAHWLRCSFLLPLPSPWGREAFSFKATTVSLGIQTWGVVIWEQDRLVLTCFVSSIGMAKGTVFSLKLEASLHRFGRRREETHKPKAHAGLVTQWETTVSCCVWTRLLIFSGTVVSYKNKPISLKVT